MTGTLAFGVVFRHIVDLLGKRFVPLQFQTRQLCPLAGLLVLLAGRPGVRGRLRFLGFEHRGIEFLKFGELDFAVVRLTDG